MFARRPIFVGHESVRHDDSGGGAFAHVRPIKSLMIAPARRAAGAAEMAVTAQFRLGGSAGSPVQLLLAALAAQTGQDRTSALSRRRCLLIFNGLTMTSERHLQPASRRASQPARRFLPWCARFTEPTLRAPAAAATATVLTVDLGDRVAPTTILGHNSP